MIESGDEKLNESIELQGSSLQLPKFKYFVYLSYTSYTRHNRSSGLSCREQLKLEEENIVYLGRTGLEARR